MGSAAVKTRIFWLPIAVLIVVSAGYYLQRRWSAPAAKPSAGEAAKGTEARAIPPPPPAFPPVEVAPPVIATRPLALPAPPRQLAPEMVLPIQDQATIDFSIGTPVIKRGGGDDEAMRRALKEMEEATKNLTIPPRKTEASPAGK